MLARAFTLVVGFWRAISMKLWQADPQSWMQVVESGLSCGSGIYVPISGNDIQMD